MMWFRMYAEAVDNVKLRLVAYEDRWHYVALLCCKAQGIYDEESDTLRRNKLCVKLGLDPQELAMVLDRLHDVGLVDAFGHPVGWDERQFLSDSSTERVKAFRKRQRNVSVTPSDTDTDTETEKRTEARKRATRLPDSFELTDERRAYATREGINAEREFEKFRDHWKQASGSSARKFDWDAGWRLWCRRAADDLKRAPQSRPSPFARPEAPKPQECKHGLTGACIYCRREAQTSSAAGGPTPISRLLGNQ